MPQNGVSMSFSLTSRSIVSDGVVSDALRISESALTKSCFATEITTNPSESEYGKSSNSISLANCRSFVNSLFSTDEQRKKAKVSTISYCERITFENTVDYRMSESHSGTRSGDRVGVYFCQSPKCPKCSHLYRERLRDEIISGLKWILEQNKNLSDAEKLSPLMFTLTASNNTTDVAEFTSKFKKSIGEFRKYTHYRNWKYWFSSIEATLYRLQNGLHVHSHLLILIPNKDLENLHKKVFKAWRGKLEKCGLSCSGRGLRITNMINKPSSFNDSEKENKVSVQIEDFVRYLLKDNYKDSEYPCFVSGAVELDDRLARASHEVLPSQHAKLGKGVSIERVIAYLAGELEIPHLENMAADPMIRGYVKAYYENIGYLYQKSKPLSAAIKLAKEAHDPNVIDNEIKTPNLLVTVKLDSDGWKYLDMKSRSESYSFSWDMLEFWKRSPDIHKLVDIFEKELTTKYGFKYHYDIYFEDNDASRNFQKEYYLRKQQSQAMALAA